LTYRLFLFRLYFLNRFPILRSFLRI